MFSDFLFLLSSSFIVLMLILLLFSKDIMHNCIFLLGVLIGVAGIYITLGADFVGAAQILVYVGGVTILMLFAVMLTGGNDSAKNKVQNFYKTNSMGNIKNLGYAFVSMFIFLLSVGKIIYRYVLKTKTEDLSVYHPTIEEIGSKLITDHVLAFEISSVLLLGALVGAAIIARPSKMKREKIN